MTDQVSNINELVLNDPSFCDALVRDPEATLRARGIEPTPEVVNALKAVDADGLRKLVSAFGQQQAAM
ncbi:MAG: Os1348 family NHLP clan protein [Xanthomonadales bacterium]|jgi:hypothetical protein|nr:Os1348 family NHLP clan protein [Xanthomonadales bacterium]